MKTIRLYLILFLGVMCSLYLNSCEENDDAGQTITESESEAGSQDSSSSTTNYTLNDLAGVWFSLDYDSTLSQIDTYTSQGNANMVNSRDDIYGFEITSTGNINEVVLYMSTSSSSTGDVHKSFFVSGETIYWMLRDYGSYLSNVVVSEDEILYNGTAYYTISSSSVITYFNGDLYKKR